MSSLFEPVRPPAYHARPLAGATTQVRTVVHALFREAPVPSPELVAGVGAFPVCHRPTDQPGQILADPISVLRFWTCDARRDQLAHYQRLTQAEAFALDPRLEEFVLRAHRDGDDGRPVRGWVTGAIRADDDGASCSATTPRCRR